jgi:predicted house-cleaning noncanonical NTP pyrophosphatase (MazG superfamily)
MNDNKNGKTVSTHIADSAELKLESKLQEQFGLGSRSNTSVISDSLSASSDLRHSLRKSKVRCNAIKHM